jgi:hypothetical protein
LATTAQLPFDARFGSKAGTSRSAAARFPEKIYGLAIGSSYQKQGLTLSKQFVRDGVSL